MCVSNVNTYFTFIVGGCVTSYANKLLKIISVFIENNNESVAQCLDEW